MKNAISNVITGRPHRTARALLVASLLGNLSVAAWYVLNAHPFGPTCTVGSSAPSLMGESGSLTSARNVVGRSAIGASTSPSKHISAPVAPVPKPFNAEVGTEKPAAEMISRALGDLSDANGDGVLENPLATWHREFVKDAPDSAWSPMAASQAESYLTSVLGPDIELIGIKCGGRVCEVQAASRSSEDGEKAAASWQENIAAMSEESWWASYGFGTPNSAIWRTSDGRVLFVSYLTRVSDTGYPGG